MHTSSFKEESSTGGSLGSARSDADFILWTLIMIKCFVIDSAHLFNKRLKFQTLARHTFDHYRCHRFTSLYFWFTCLVLYHFLVIIPSWFLLLSLHFSFFFYLSLFVAVRFTLFSLFPLTLWVTGEFGRCSISSLGFLFEELTWPYKNNFLRCLFLFEENAYGFFLNDGVWGSWDPLRAREKDKGILTSNVHVNGFDHTTSMPCRIFLTWRRYDKSICNPIRFDE